jgi:catechol 2,3-dioxygenase-like lactoylglutathione lyase family enzyme
MISTISHVAIKTADLDGTIRFYTEVLGMELKDRPPFEFPGAWVGTAEGGAIIHLYSGDPGLDVGGRPFVGSAAVDHFSCNARGYAGYRRRFAEEGLDWREQAVPKTPLWQLFVYDPNGVMVELVFDSRAEEGPAPEMSGGRWYEPGVNFYRGAAN